jgi:Flp pilus assembly pilin Flp
MGKGAIRCASRWLHERRSRFAHDESGVAQLEYLTVLCFVCLPMALALVPLAIVILEKYVNMREIVLYATP